MKRNNCEKDFFQEYVVCCDFKLLELQLVLDIKF
jgi:hypothetical protein